MHPGGRVVIGVFLGMGSAGPTPSVVAAFSCTTLLERSSTPVAVSYKPPKCRHEEAVLNSAVPPD